MVKDKNDDSPVLAIIETLMIGIRIFMGTAQTGNSLLRTKGFGSQ
jgi:hypothetical protein